MSVMTVGTYPSADSSARAIIQGALDQFGLSGLGDWAWGLYQGGASIDEIMLKVRQTPEYKTRYPAMEELARQGRAISEASYIDFERTVHSLLQQYGIPKGMYDTPADIANFLTRGLAAPEIASRLQLAAAASFNAPPEERQAMIDYYGVTPGGMIAYWLDPDKALPLLEQQRTAAQIGAAAKMQQIGLDRSTAEGLAKRGITYDQAVQGFQQVAGTGALGGGFGETVAEQERIAAQFGDQQAQQRVQRVQKARLAAFEGGGGPAETSRGASGLGAASSR